VTGTFAPFVERADIIFGDAKAASCALFLIDDSELDIL